MRVEGRMLSMGECHRPRLANPDAGECPFAGAIPCTNLKLPRRSGA